MHEMFAAFNEGGVFMYLILALSIFSLALTIQKAYLFWFRYRMAEDEFAKSVIRQIEADNYARALQYCNGRYHPLTTILKAGLMRANKAERDIRRAIETAANEVVPKFRRGVAALPHLSNIATMLGLLGTIRGLIIAFSGMATGDAAKRNDALSMGIAVAFRATFFALSVAVVVVFFYVVLNGKQNKMLAKMEHVTNMIVDALVEKNKRVSTTTRQAG